MSTEGETRLPLAVKPASTPRSLGGTSRDSLAIDMLLSAVYVLVVARPSSEVAEKLMNYPAHIICINVRLFILPCIWVRFSIDHSEQCIDSYYGYYTAASANR
jgi:hypothetical protein